MARLITILTLILAILLFPPAALALISNNAVPGDATYPIKRGLEAVILKVVSIHPTTYAWFSIERSNRRFEEATTLLTRGTKATDTLDELVVQTESVAKEIAQIKDPVRKQELTQKLHKEIQKYDEGLEKVKKDLVQAEPQPTLTPASPTPKATPQPSPTASAGTATPAPSPKILKPSPIVGIPSPSPSVSISSPTPKPIVISPAPSPTPIKVPPDTDDIDKTRERLREIKEGLAAAALDRDRDREDNENRGKREDLEHTDKSDQKERGRSDEKSERKEDKSRH